MIHNNNSDMNVIHHHAMACAYEFVNRYNYAWDVVVIQVLTMTY